ncbi:MAG TPA: hypothetical protein VFN31_03035 [Candidatus Saccharimonadales bacterium]|nr:hypothetical protein [Candidatus Saccharimonadales bacterium]
MSAELLEQQTDRDLESMFLLHAYQDGIHAQAVMSVTEMAEDLAPKIRTANFLSKIALNTTVEIEDIIPRPIANLYEGIKRGARGDETARRMVELNATTDITERSIKTGFIFSPIKVNVLPEGRAYQHDQLMDSVQANSLRLMANNPIMLARTQSELRNSFRIEALNQHGYLDDYSFVVFSLAENLPEAGFFTETMSCSIQVTSKNGDHLSLQPALVSGIKEPGQQRHDLSTIKRLYARFGIDLKSKTPAEIIDTPLLIHNSLLPNGVVDVVRLWDASAGGTFFGETRPAQDYISYARLCNDKQKEFGLRGKLIAVELFKAVDSIGSAVEATRLMNKISEKYALFNALVDNSIDARVFGSVAAWHLENSRQHLLTGDLAQAEAEITYALATAVSYSCPTAYGSAGEDEFGSLSFNCPHCGSVNTRLPGRENFISSCKFCTSSVECK